jgi:hypothetical protein
VSENPADLWRKVADLRKRWQILEKSGGFEANSQVVSFGETMADFPKIRQFFSTVILKLMVFSRNLFNEKAALILCLGDASVKQHLPVPRRLFLAAQQRIAIT